MKSIPLEFSSDDRQYHGLLDLPDQSQGAMPLMVFVHGSGPTSVHLGYEFREQRKVLAEAGVACVSWDKPGCGKSAGEPGDWDLLTFDGRAREVLAAVEKVSGEVEIDSSKIGLWGISQGGWVCPLAHSMKPEIALMILVSGAARTSDVQTIYFVSQNLRIAGHSDEEIAEFMQTFSTVLELIGRGASPGQVIKTATPILDSPLLGTLIANDPSHSFQQVPPLFRRFPFLATWLSVLYPRNRQLRKIENHNNRFDAKDLLTQVNCPILAQFGEKDSIVDWRESVDVYREATKESGNQNLEIKTYPDSDHSLCLSETGAARELIERKEWILPQAVLTDMLDFLKKHEFILTG